MPLKKNTCHIAAPRCCGVHTDPYIYVSRANYSMCIDNVSMLIFMPRMLSLQSKRRSVGWVTATHTVGVPLNEPIRQIS